MRKLLCTVGSIPGSLDHNTAKSASFLYGENYLLAPVNFYRERRSRAIAELQIALIQLRFLLNLLASFRFLHYTRNASFAYQ
jgi:hypothetical protein